MAPANRDSDSSGIIWRDVGQRIKQAREEAGLTQPQLAVAMKSDEEGSPHVVTISRWESKGDGILLSQLERISAATNRSVRWLLFGDVLPLDVDAIIARAKAEAFKETADLMESKIVQLRGTAWRTGSDFAYGKLSILSETPETHYGETPAEFEARTAKPAKPGKRKGKGEDEK